MIATSTSTITHCSEYDLMYSLLIKIRGGWDSLNRVISHDFSGGGKSWFQRRVSYRLARCNAARGDSVAF